jgi:hypothetical protein
MLEKGEPFPAHCALSPGLSRLLSSSICMKHHTSPDVAYQSVLNLKKSVDRSILITGI